MFAPDSDTPPHLTQPRSMIHCAAGIGRVIFQPACSPDLVPLDKWAWDAVKREMLAVRGRIALRGTAARAWAAVRSCQQPGRLLRDWRARLAFCIATTCSVHISTDALEL